MASSNTDLRLFAERYLSFLKSRSWSSALALIGCGALLLRLIYLFELRHSIHTSWL